MNYVLAFKCHGDWRRDVNKSIGFHTIAVSGVLLLMIGTLKAKDLSVASSPVVSACESFGIVKSLVERKAPPFCLKTLNGGQVTLDDFRGKPVLVKFWATWCPSCVEELPMMVRFSQEIKDQLVILMPAIDGEKEKKVRRVIEKNKVALPVLLDPKAKTARAYGVNMIPVSFLINGEGLILGTVLGERDWSSPKAWLAVKELFTLR